MAALRRCVSVVVSFGEIHFACRRRLCTRWQNFKTVFVEQRQFFDSSPPIANPRIIKLLTDPKEREPVDSPHLHTWVVAHFTRLIAEFQASIQREPLIPFGAPLNFVPAASQDN